jgi:hypothetical protein
MKKTIPALLLACVLFACKKDTNSVESPASDAKKPVTFSVQNFLVTQQDMSANGRVETLPQIANIYYYAYRSDGKNASTKQQSYGTPNFGVITDSLAPGTYTIVLAASSKSLNYFYTMNVDLPYAYLTEGTTANMGDFFWKKFQITISDNGNPPTMDVSLNRIVGLLQANLKDALPASDPNGAAINVTVKYPVSAIEFATEAPFHIHSEENIARINQTTWEYYILGTSQALTVTINWKDKTTGAAMSKTIPNLVVSANKKTIINGYLYGVPDNLGGSDYIVRYNSDWSTDSTVVNIN